MQGPRSTLEILGSVVKHDVHAEFTRMNALGVRFTQEPTGGGPVTIAVFDDTCGNLIRIATLPA